MFDILLWAAVFVVSLFFVIKSADWFTEGAEKLALSVGVSQWVIGLTLLALGTSLPELFTSFTASFAGMPELVVDNVVGSNIANILLIIGISAIFARKLVVNRDLIDLDLPILLVSQTIFVFTIWDGKVSVPEGIILLLVLVIYLAYSMRVHEGETTGHHHKKENMLKLSGIIIASLVVLIFASKYTITSMIELGTLLGISASILGVTALAVGTSLPELMVSVSAARKGNFEMSLGNILGSNIFNAAGIVGLVSLFFGLTVSATTLSIGLGFLIASTLLCVISGISKRIHLWEGLLFVLLYVVFIGKLFGLF